MTAHPKTAIRPDVDLAVRGINHVAVLTRDADRLHRFYREVFGVTVWHDQTDGDIRLSFVTIGTYTQLNVFEIDGNTEANRQQPMFGRGRLDHLGLEAASREAFDQVRRRLIACGASDGFVTDFGLAHSLFFRDPDGMECELCLHDPTATPADLKPPGTPAAGYPPPGRPSSSAEHDRDGVPRSSPIPVGTLAKASFDEHGIHEGAGGPGGGLFLLDGVESAQVAQDDHGLPADDGGQGGDEPLELFRGQSGAEGFDGLFDPLDAAVSASGRAVGRVHLGGVNGEADEPPAEREGDRRQLLERSGQGSDAGVHVVAVRGGVQGGVDACAAQGPGGGVDEELVDRGEVHVHGPPGDVGGRGDLVDGRGVAVGEQLGGGVDDGFAGPSALRHPALVGLGHGILPMTP